MAAVRARLGPVYEWRDHTGATAVAQERGDEALLTRAKPRRHRRNADRKARTAIRSAIEHVMELPIDGNKMRGLRAKITGSFPLVATAASSRKQTSAHGRYRPQPDLGQTFQSGRSLSISPLTCGHFHGR